MLQKEVFLIFFKYFEMMFKPIIKSNFLYNFSTKGGGQKIKKKSCKGLFFNIDIIF